MADRELATTGTCPPSDTKPCLLDIIGVDGDGFAGVFLEHKFEIVKHLQGLGYLCTMTSDDSNETRALSRANGDISFERATDATRGAVDVVPAESGLSTIVHAIRGSRIIFQRMRNHVIYARVITICQPCLASVPWIRLRFSPTPSRGLCLTLLMITLVILR
ncbi:unnamed protein product [Peniophora sp. CBMAI 1063]|nr:unnamed protein product [Peniophora sp. CBMAI 1063]